MRAAVHRASDRVFSPLRVCLAAFVLLWALAAGAGCEGFMQRQTGSIMGGYAAEHMVPYMMASSDLAMACETGVSMGAFLMSFERITDPPEKAALVTLLAAGMCAEDAAWEADLHQLRAVRDGRASEALDARLLEQRHHAVAAQRFYAAYGQLESAFGSPGGRCPELEREDELFYLLGLSAGMLAVIHDRKAEGVAEVPMDIPVRVSRAAACLDGERWWGAPLALQASVWAMVPGASPEGSDPWAVLTEATRLGEADGVRLARAFQVQILEATGREGEVREAITAHAASSSRPTDPDWRLLDSYATRMILHVSDRLWTAERGHRTPLGALGTFGPAQAEERPDDALFDDLFETLEEPPPVDAPDTPQTDPEETE
jgi:hypothetical protein